MKTIVSKPRNLFIVIVLFLFSLTACSAIGPTASTLIAPEASNPTAFMPAAGESDVAHTVPTTSIVNTGISNLQSISDLEASLIQVYQGANPAVVYIITPSGSGSGFVYGQDGYIVTNNHVVVGARSFEVVFANGERRRAVLIGADADSDLAVIQVDQLPQGVTPLPLGDSDNLMVGQLVVAIGNPFGEQGSMTLGIVSGLGRSLPSQRDRSVGTTYSLSQVIQTDAPINPGNSGGPLLNLDGEVVGVNAAIASQTGENSGVGFSIPVSAVRLIVPALVEKGSYQYPYIGAAFASEISLDDTELLELPQTQGAYVVNITSGSPADQAGLVAADSGTGRGGDLIVAIDGISVQDFSDLNSYLIFHTSLGQTIELSILRDGTPLTIPLTLGTRP
jgi:S1-C subfamily serine protease